MDGRVWWLGNRIIERLRRNVKAEKAAGGVFQQNQLFRSHCLLLLGPLLRDRPGQNRDLEPLLMHSQAPLEELSRLDIKTRTGRPRPWLLST